jgi:hypothetical protein
MTDDELKALEAAAKAATRGPWRWELNEKGKTISLEGGKPKFDMSVIRFRRYGMAGAMPEFQVDGLMRPATDFAKVVPGREHHASWFKGIDHPDVNYIAAASPDVILRLTAELRKAREKWAQYERDAIHEAHEAATLRARVAELESAQCICPACGTEWCAGDTQRCGTSICEDRNALSARVSQLEGVLRWIEMDTRDPSAPNERSNKRAREALAAGKNGGTNEAGN